MSSLELMNSGLMVAVSIGAACQIDKMNRWTAHTVRVAMVLVLVGAIAEAIAPWRQEWATWIDTLFFGGVGALIFADRRFPPVTGADGVERADAQVARRRQMAIVARFISAAISAATVFLVLLAWSTAHPRLTL